jgi:pimeloyl-ACP methyl ester carboxylesterase
MSKKFVNPADFIMPININGMDGRYLRIENPNRHNRREILFIYDMEANLEKWWGMAVALKVYANVTMVDLPGLGGMDSFYSIGLKPSFDNMADYLASFIKLKYKRKRLTIMGVGFGYAVVTRMLQRNPDVTKKVNSLVAINGYDHKDDFKLKKFDVFIMRIYSYLCSRRFIAWLLNATAYSTMALKYKYPVGKVRSFRGGPSKEFVRQFKIDLVKCTDLRTRMYLNLQLLKLDNCKIRIRNSMWHVTTSNSDQNVDKKLVEQHFRVTYEDYVHLPTKISGSMPIVLNDEKTAIKYLPAKLRRHLKTSA